METEIGHYYMYDHGYFAGIIYKVIGKNPLFGDHLGTQGLSGYTYLGTLVKSHPNLDHHGIFGVAKEVYPGTRDITDTYQIKEDIKKIIGE